MIPPAPETFEEAAHRWMREHPVATDLLRRFAAQLAAARRKFGFRLLAERVRWEYAVDSKLQGDEFKLNDHHTPYIARALARENPAIAEFIECRVTKAKHKPARPGIVLPRVDSLTDEILP